MVIIHHRVITPCSRYTQRKNEWRSHHGPLPNGASVRLTLNGTKVRPKKKPTPEMLEVVRT